MALLSPVKECHFWFNLCSLCFHNFVQTTRTKILILATITFVPRFAIWNSWWCTFWMQTNSWYNRTAMRWRIDVGIINSYNTSAVVTIQHRLANSKHETSIEFKRTNQKSSFNQLAYKALVIRSAIYGVCKLFGDSRVNTLQLSKTEQTSVEQYLTIQSVVLTYYHKPKRLRYKAKHITNVASAFVKRRM